MHPIRQNKTDDNHNIFCSCCSAWLYEFLPRKFKAEMMEKATTANTTKKKVKRTKRKKEKTN
jgi:hypothetical protein